MKKVLFIGNSHTYFNDMPAMFKVMGKGFKEIGDIQVAVLAHPYKTLDYHMNQKEVRFNILYGEYDYVVLQQGAHPFSGEGELIKCSKVINEFIKQSGATPVAYMTWSQKDEMEKQEEMTNAYIAMAKEIDGILAPVGRVFEVLRKNNPEIDLYHEDGGHASLVGSYIAAATILTSIFNVNPLDIESKLSILGNEVFIDDKTASIIKNAIKNIKG